MYDSKKEQDSQSQTNSTDLAETKNDSKNGSSNAINLANSSTSANNQPTIGNSANPFQVTPISTHLPVNPQSNNGQTISKLNPINTYRNGSFIVSNSNATQFTDLNQVKPANLLGDDKPAFYLNPDTNISNLKFGSATSTNSHTTDANDLINEENNSNNQVGSLITTKPVFQSLEKNMVFLVYHMN